MDGTFKSLAIVALFAAAMTGCAGAPSDASRAEAVERCSLTYGPGSRGFDLCLREAGKKGS